MTMMMMMAKVGKGGLIREQTGFYLQLLSVNDRRAIDVPG